MARPRKHKPRKQTFRPGKDDIFIQDLEMWAKTIGGKYKRALEQARTLKTPRIFWTQPSSIPWAVEGDKINRRKTQSVEILL